ncbi:MAG: hypothetical protein E6Q68_07185 [Polynucleobacter sp.]|nr:MAG: hypothetical protein E6Q68_07185 [Polynucleobacter sp.]
MATRALVLNEQTRADIKKVISHAEHNIFTEEDMVDRINNPGKHKPPGDIEEFKCFVPIGFRCVFTIEKQPIGWCRHLSVSIDAKDKVPSFAATLELAREFGMDVKAMEDFDHSWIEEIEPGKSAVNVLTKITPKNAKTSEDVADK